MEASIRTGSTLQSPCLWLPVALTLLLIGMLALTPGAKGASRPSGVWEESATSRSSAASTRIWVHPNRPGPDYAEPGGGVLDFGDIFARKRDADWQEVRSRIYGFSFFAQNPAAYDKHFFTRAFDYLQAHGKRIRFEYTPYNAQACTTKVAFDAHTRSFFQRVRELARQTKARIEYVTLDSPWRFLRDECHISSDRAIAREVAQLTEKLSRLLPPKVKIGEIEVFFGPAAGSRYLSPARYGGWFDAYRRYVQQAHIGTALKHFHVDFDWTIVDQEGEGGALALIRQLQAVARQRGKLFSLLFSGSNGSVVPDDIFASNQAYYDEVLREVNLVVNAGIRLDEYIIQSFFSKPTRALPESESATFMNVARDAIRRIP